MSDRATNLIITGVGGQGNVLAARLVGAALLAEGYEVAVGDVFGLAQRGGSVTSHVRFRESGPLPPLVRPGELDLVVGFEPLEALRTLCSHGSAATRVLTNDRPVPTTGTMMGRHDYPPTTDLLGHLRALSAEVCTFDAVTLAHGAGSAQALNLVMVGALVGWGLVPIAEATMRAQMAELLPARAAVANDKAFTLGLAAVAARGAAAD
ncbi:MAG: indolepyruvate oxidoreductase subunit beta [Thermoleophilia bacterium]